MPWALAHRAHPRAVRIADRHYNRQKIGSPQFVPPGGCLVLLATTEDALWVTSTPMAEYVRHAWAGAWVNSLFRNEGATLASTLITAALAASRYVLGEPPAEGIVTFVDADKVRHKRDPGRCYRRAGWKVVGHTAGGLLALGLLPADWPAPEAPFGTTGELL